MFFSLSNKYTKIFHLMLLTQLHTILEICSAPYKIKSYPTILANPHIYKSIQFQNPLCIFSNDDIKYFIF